jgi:hypothetical protein
VLSCRITRNNPLADARGSVANSSPYKPLLSRERKQAVERPGYANLRNLELACMYAVNAPGDPVGKNRGRDNDHDDAGKSIHTYFKVTIDSD